MRPILLVILLASPAAGGPPDDARALLQRAISAFQRNQEQEIHWNWTATEERTLLGKDGAEQKLPEVTVESVIRSDGRRCNAVLSWGDGTAPYLIDSDPDSRCQATEAFRPAFDVSELLKSNHVRLVSRPPKDIVLTILPDKEREKATDRRVSCAASIRATVALDPLTSFPRQIDGELVGSGCAPTAEVPLHYGREDVINTRLSFQKGAKFYMTFELQPDRFQNPQRSFWIRVSEHYEMPLVARTGAMVVWGRRFPMTIGLQRVVKDVRTVAREFGTETTIR
ncbi:MAG TPA: hypothetical protein VML19_14110 [Verrucomicrobiae bacterium]|nr:hypothetical protein [Verrucomicrobiae bacterium]